MSDITIEYKNVIPTNPSSVDYGTSPHFWKDTEVVTTTTSWADVVATLAIPDTVSLAGVVIHNPSGGENVAVCQDDEDRYHHIPAGTSRQFAVKNGHPLKVKHFA